MSVCSCVSLFLCPFPTILFDSDDWRLLVFWTGELSITKYNEYEYEDFFCGKVNILLNKKKSFQAVNFVLHCYAQQSQVERLKLGKTEQCNAIYTTHSGHVQCTFETVHNSLPCSLTTLPTLLFLKASPASSKKLALAQKGVNFLHHFGAAGAATYNIYMTDLLDMIIKASSWLGINIYVPHSLPKSFLDFTDFKRLYGVSQKGGGGCWHHMVGSL